MKTISIILGSVALAITASAQNSTYSGISFNKQQKQGIVAEYNFTEDMVSDALEKEIEKAGIRGKSTKGFTVYKGIQVNEISSNTIDLYVKTESKSKKEKNKTVVSLLISKGYDYFMEPAVDGQLFENAKNYLSKITTTLAARDLANQIDQQEETVKKENKKLENYQDDIKELEKKIRKLTDDIEGRKKDIEAQRSEVARQQLILDNLRVKRI